MTLPPIRHRQPALPNTTNRGDISTVKAAPLFSSQEQQQQHSSSRGTAYHQHDATQPPPLLPLLLLPAVGGVRKQQPLTSRQPQQYRSSSNERPLRHDSSSTAIGTGVVGSSASQQRSTKLVRRGSKGGSNAQAGGGSLTARVARGGNGGSGDNNDTTRSRNPSLIDRRDTHHLSSTATSDNMSPTTLEEEHVVFGDSDRNASTYVRRRLQKLRAEPELLARYTARCDESQAERMLEFKERASQMTLRTTALSPSERQHLHRSHDEHIAEVRERRRHVAREDVAARQDAFQEALLKQDDAGDRREHHNWVRLLCRRWLLITALQQTFCALDTAKRQGYRLRRIWLIVFFTARRWLKQTRRRRDKIDALRFNLFIRRHLPAMVEGFRLRRNMAATPIVRSFLTLCSRAMYFTLALRRYRKNLIRAQRFVRKRFSTSSMIRVSLLMAWHRERAALEKENMVVVPVFPPIIIDFIISHVVAEDNQRYLRAKQALVTEFKKDLAARAEAARLRRRLARMISNTSLLGNDGGVLPDVDIEELEVGSAKRLFVERQHAASRRLLDDADLAFVGAGGDGGGGGGALRKQASVRLGAGGAAPSISGTYTSGPLAQTAAPPPSVSASSKAQQQQQQATNSGTGSNTGGGGGGASPSGKSFTTTGSTDGGGGGGVTPQGTDIDGGAGGSSGGGLFLMGSGGGAPPMLSAKAMSLRRGGPPPGGKAATAVAPGTLLHPSQRLKHSTANTTAVAGSASNAAAGAAGLLKRGGGGGGSNPSGGGPVVRILGQGGPGAHAAPSSSSAVVGPSLVLPKRPCFCVPAIMRQLLQVSRDHVYAARRHFATSKGLIGGARGRSSSVAPGAGNPSAAGQNATLSAAESVPWPPLTSTADVAVLLGDYSWIQTFVSQVTLPYYGAKSVSSAAGAAANAQS